MTAPTASRPFVRRLAILPLLIALSTAGVVVAQPDPRVAESIAAVDSLFSWATAGTPGCAVAVDRRGERVIDRAYGLADLDGGVPLTPTTRFDVGSVTKQFVAAAVLLLVEDGRLALDDDIRQYVPELPDPGAVVTLDHLLTHTGGVRDWTGLQMLARGEETALALTLRQGGLNFAPGAEWSYSNSGYVLLKEVVARVAGAPFSEVARERLFEPLGMTSTEYAEDPQDGTHGRLAVAYQEVDGRWEPGVLSRPERGGGGGLLSTARDLLIWNAALEDGRLGAFVTDALQRPARLQSGREIGYARGLFLDRIGGHRAVWHSGSAGAYKTLVARFPEDDLSLAIACNAGDSRGAMRFAGPIREQFLPTDKPDAATEAAGEAAGVDVERWAGLYLSEPGVDGADVGEARSDPMRLVEQQGRLRVDGGPWLVPVAADRLRPVEHTLTFQSDDEVELRFASPDAFDLVGSDGRATRYHRADPYAPTAAERKALAGRYESAEVNGVLVVTAEGDGLTIRLNDSRAFPLTPLARDTYGLGRMTLRFVRDAEGTVVGIDYSTPVLRHLLFPRTPADTTRP